ncbi:glycosyltransferase family 39 protein [Roseovarius sp. Pro17]|uniref:glycosyltransferase family 39 protein n=1 Tax=Roseovarius sp. Pro17 TaxID=3108175 RepID=UPI002D79A4CB|nr:glycosyltransferase family 39 protein [Roseovarius sp. Pro17]
MALAAAILSFRLGWQDYWWDEHVTLMFTQSNWRELMVDYWGLDTHRPVYYGLQKAWNSLFGTGVTNVRTLPVVVTLLLIPIFYLIARRIRRGPLAILTVLLLTSAPMFVDQGREIRMYCLLNLALSVALLLAIILATEARQDEPQSRGRMLALWSGFAASMAFAFYVQAVAAFVALLFALWILVAVIFGLLPLRFLLQALAASLLYIILIIPALLPFLGHFGGTLGGTFWVPEPTASYVYGQTAAAYPYPKWTKPIIGLLLLWGLWSAGRRVPQIALLLALLIFGLPILVYLISFAKPIYMTRVIAWASIVSVLPLAYGLAAFGPVLRWGGLAFVVAAQMIWLAGFYPSEPERSPFAAFAEPLADFDPQTDIFVLGSQIREPPLRWYYPHLFEGASYAFLNGDSQHNVIDPAFRSNFVMRSEASALNIDGDQLFVFWETEFEIPVSDEDSVTKALQTITKDLNPVQTFTEGRYRLDVYDLESD